MFTREELSDLYLRTSCLTREGFNLVCVTFNVNASVEESFDGLLNEILESNSGTLPDIFVVGLQEVVPLNAQNIVGASLFSEGEEAIDRWLWIILTALSRIEGQYDSSANAGNINPYELLIHEHMVGLWMCVVVSKSIRPAVKNVQKSQCQRGVGGGLGLGGNKGAVCVRFDLLDSSICLVNAHFAANRGALTARNADFHAILHKEMFRDPFLEATSTSHSTRPDMTALQATLRGLRGRMQEKLDDDGEVRLSERSGQGQDKGVSTSRESAIQDRRGSDSSIAIGESSFSSTLALELDSAGSRLESIRDRPSVPALSDDLTSSSSSSALPDLQSSVEAAAEGRKLSPNDHDVVVFLGDLNYRIDKSVPDAHVFALIEAGRLADLADLDQLNIEKDKGNIFEGFHEGILNFPPTYKYLHHTDDYDRRPDKKPRCPSWCDRVLWRTAASLEQEVTMNSGAGAESGTGAGTGRVQGLASASTGYGLPMHTENVELMCYSRGSSSISDHKPVYASLNVKVKRVDWAATEQLLLDVMNEFAFYDGGLREALTRSGLAPLAVEPASINLHSLPPVGDSVQLKLFNRLDCSIKFVVDPMSVPPWLQLDCIEGTIASGDKLSLRAACDHILASQAYGDDVMLLDASCSPGARVLLEVASRPEVTALLVVQLKAIREKESKEEAWRSLDSGTLDGGCLVDVLLPVVAYLGAPTGDVS